MAIDTNKILDEIGKFYENVEKDNKSIVLKTGKWFMWYSIDEDDINLTCYIASPVKEPKKSSYEELNALNMKSQYGTYMCCEFENGQCLYMYHSVVSIESFKKLEVKDIVKAFNAEAEKGLIVLTSEKI